MQWIKNASRLLPMIALAAVLGCTSSPTEPSSGGGPPVSPKPPDPVLAYVITVTANPSEISTGTTSSANVNVEVRRADNGQAPPDLTPVTLTTNLGGFGTSGGPQSVTLQLVGGRGQAVLFAGPETGTATVRAELNGSAGAANVRIGEPATFFISSIEPNIGSANGGEQVTILGGGFENPVRVTFNGTAATVRSVSANRIVVTSPSAAAAGVPVGVGQTASVAVQVTINVNEVDEESDVIDRGFTFTLGGGTQQPQVFTVDPSLGTNDGGTRVTIIGDGFVAPVQVLFGRGTSATTFNGVEARVESVTPNRIVVVTPAATGFGQNLTNQVVDVLVKNANTGFSTVGLQQFKYGTNVLITAIGPSGGPADGGTRVSIQGQGFDDPLTVAFHFRDTNLTVAQQVLSVSGTQIVVLTGAAPLPATCPANGIVAADSISVTNIQTGDTATANIGFNFLLPQPQITGVSPGTGGTGSVVTISGQNFSNRVEVIFGTGAGSSAQVQSSTSTSLQVIVPNPPSGFTFTTQPCGLNNAGTQSIPTAINITVRDLDSRCASIFANGFLLVPSDGSCRQTPPPPPTPPVANFSFFVVDPALHRIQFTDSSTGAPTGWQWDFTNDGSFESSLQNPQFTFPAAGTYAVRLRATNAGGSHEIVKQVAVP
jgi:PKD repeat protein